MPPKKRRAGPSVEKAGSSAKVPRSDETDGACIDGISVQFEWSADDEWTAYTDEQCAVLCDACENKKSSINIEGADGKKLSVQFKNGIQKSPQTGDERSVRISVKDTSETAFYVWQWEDSSSWQNYGIDAVLKLEKLYQEDKTTDAPLVVNLKGREKHQISLKEMQADNRSTKETVKIRRQKTDAKVAEKGQGDAKKSAAKTESQKTSTDNEDLPKSKGQKSKAKSRASAQSPKEKIKTYIVKGRAPVDPECKTKVHDAHVYCEGNDIYDAMLNQTNVQFNNNKFYLLQLLENDSGPPAFSVWFRWGRVGQVGQSSLNACGSNLDQAKKLFCKKFTEKTKNDWGTRHNFVKVPGKYDLVEVDYQQNTNGTEDSVDGESSADVPDSKLDKRIQDLISLICDVKNMEQTLKEMKYDAKKAPLGKLTKNQIQAGYEALKEVEDCIKRNDFGASMVAACNKFYTRIPHDFGMRTPPLIRTEPEVKAKNDMLQALADIEVAMNIIKHKQADENPIDTHYKDMHCELKPVDKETPSFTLLEKYLRTTHAPTHNQYTMELEELFEVVREGEENKFKDHGNNMLLWHGSRLSNWMGILNKGLRIAPPEAPVTGYMFGKGIYFADMASKSANYCYATFSKSVGLLLLSEVSLGQTNDLLAADINAHKLPSGKNSVKGLGSIAPELKEYSKLSNGTLVPCGKPTKTGVHNPAGYTLNYNEFIVYDPDQVKMKYLMKVKFNFKR